MDEKKKIGILTFSYSSNCGSIMQAIALQKTISSFENCEASIIHYTKNKYCKPIIGKTVFTRPFRNWKPKKVVEWTLRLLTHSWKMKRFEKFFQEHYNNFSEKPFSREELTCLNDVYDKFVVGSDQVWNYGSAQVDDTFFLDFVKDNSKKISYATSFGQKNVPAEKREIAGKFISDFSAVSVREPDGVNIVSALANRKATLVLDPSLLLSKEEYHKLSVPPKKKGYVLLYVRRNDKQLEAFARKLARANNLTVIKMCRNWLCGKSGIPKTLIGPNEWLGYMENADYVVTNSFHGICFSIIFERQFFVGLLEKTSTVTNSRLEGMMSQFNLSGRCIDDAKDIHALSPIDYNIINEFKTRRIDESLSYLKKAIEGNGLS